VVANGARRDCRMTLCGECIAVPADLITGADGSWRMTVFARSRLSIRVQLAPTCACTMVTRLTGSALCCSAQPGSPRRNETGEMDRRACVRS